MNPDHTIQDIAPFISALSEKREKIILLGAGACGGYVLRHLRAKGIEPVAVADNNPSKWGTSVKRSTCVDGIEGVTITSPSVAKHAYPDATWIACAISRPAAVELREQLKYMKVKTKPLWEVLPVCHGLPPEKAWSTILELVNDSDAETINTLWDQHHFREHPDYALQMEPSDIKDIYFPDFIAHREDEHFVDAGGGDGDTVKAFTDRWENYKQITVFEPDPANMQKIREATWQNDRIIRFDKALSDHMHDERFTANADYSSHLGGDGTLVTCWTLDELFAKSQDNYPTYIKMDIESAEPEALWGARHILHGHSPVLAICAYHKSEHLWSLPLLIHALQPDYRLFLRRYAEGAFELVYYAVPPERVK